MSKTVTDTFTLADNEEVVRRQDRIGYGPKGMTNGELVLTNLAIIYIRKNLFGKTKEVIRLPFADIRTVDGKPQVKTNNPDHFTPLMDVYLANGMESFKFVFDTDAEEFTGAVTEQITGIAAEKKDEFAWVGDLAGMADSLAGGINKVRTSLGLKSAEEASGKCSGCGASITGHRGESVKCPYCGSFTTF